MPRRTDGADRVLVNGGRRYISIRADAGRLWQIRQFHDVVVGRIVCTSPLASSTRSRQWRLLENAILIENRRHSLKLAGCTRKPSRVPILCFLFFTSPFSSLGFALLLFKKQSPPTCKGVTSLRQHTLNDLVNIYTSSPHSFETVLFQGRAEWWSLSQLQYSLLLGCVFGQEWVLKNVWQCRSQQWAF